MKNELSQLENHVLARIAHQGPMTAYRIRQLFAGSPTDALSSSTGSIYPVVRRLERRGLIAATPVSDDDRGTRELTCTPAGRRQLRDWLRSVDGAGRLDEDPLRTRAVFLDQLTSAERRAWLVDALDASRAKLHEVTEFVRDRDVEGSERWAHRQALGAIRARVEWLESWLAAEDDIDNETTP